MQRLERHPTTDTAAALMVMASVMVGGQSGCSSPPSQVVDTSEPFEWSQAFADAEEAVLAVCGGRNGDDILAVGGRAGRAFVLSFSDGAWRVEDTPGQAGVLWWCWGEGGSEHTWAVGEGGTILERTNGVWRWVETYGVIPESVTLFGVWGTTNDDIYAVGGSLTDPAIGRAMVHYDGLVWQPVDDNNPSASTLFKVWGSSAHDIWAVGAEGAAVHFDGDVWATSDTGSQARLTGVWGTAPDDVYAVGGLGVGEVLRYDGDSWSIFVNEAEDLATVYRAPGDALYVGGNRGLLLRYQIDASGRPSPERVTRSTPFPDLDVHALHKSDAVLLGAASDLLVGEAEGSWRGSVLVHGNASLAGEIVRPMGPDGGILDAGAPDGGISDGSVPDDAEFSLPGPGEPCGSTPDLCAAGLECWYLQDTASFSCTQPCSEHSECIAFGTGACCERPGFQTLEKVCMTGEQPACNP